MIFEIPTGVVADTWGRKISYLLGALTLAIGTALYLWLWYVHASFWLWAAVSLLLGLGFTFFTGAFDAWLVDALSAAGFQNSLEKVFAQAQIVEGIAMFVGSVLGGVLAQLTNLSLPYILRIFVFIVTFVLAWILMKEVGFAPARRQKLVKAQTIWRNSIKYGLGVPAVRWIMLAAPFTSGVMIYTFYAMQPYLLKLYGNEKAYSVAGLAAAIIALSQVVGGLLAPYLKALFKYRTSALLMGTALGSLILAGIGAASSLWLVIFLLVVFGLLFAGITPVRQMYLNGIIPSEQRATILSFDSLMGSGGAVVFQPILGKSADLWGYGVSYLMSALFQTLALPFIFLAAREKAQSDPFH